jgi:hypothetical protein
MTLSSMVLSRDWQEVSVLECILGGLHMDVSVESEPRAGSGPPGKSKIDALIVDCDLNGSSQFLNELQSLENPRKRPARDHGRPAMHVRLWIKPARSLPSRNQFPWNRPCARYPPPAA